LVALALGLNGSTRRHATECSCSCEASQNARPGVIKRMQFTFSIDTSPLTPTAATSLVRTNPGDPHERFPPEPAATSTINADMFHAPNLEAILRIIRNWLDSLYRRPDCSSPWLGCFDRGDSSTCCRTPTFTAAHALCRPCSLPPMLSAAHALCRPCLSMSACLRNFGAKSSSIKAGESWQTPTMVNTYPS
jgi:hypothetical protein